LNTPCPDCGEFHDDDGRPAYPTIFQGCYPEDCNPLTCGCGWAAFVGDALGFEAGSAIGLEYDRQVASPSDERAEAVMVALRDRGIEPLDYSAAFDAICEEIALDSVSRN
jgi:hypothetical protein